MHAMIHTREELYCVATSGSPIVDCNGGHNVAEVETDPAILHATVSVYGHMNWFQLSATLHAMFL